MNLIPLNGMCQSISGDVDTLPAWSSMNPYFLQPHENLLVSSEDVKCFFYTMSLPDSWVKFLAFNKPVPTDRVPESMTGEQVYIAARVLPMGFLNSVSLAQHVHRNLVTWGRGEEVHENPREAELRKDFPFSYHPANWRVYLDNFDLLEKVEATRMVETQQECPSGVLSLRSSYEHCSSRCEVQGATVDGVLGIAFPRESKLAKYFSLAVSLLRALRASQRQWQVVCGGLVYVAMFRRPLLGCLNAVWRHIVSFEERGPRYRPTPRECKLEVSGFLCLLPLARLDFRMDVSPMVTCSDASSSGGGICQSVGLTGIGSMVANGALRGQVPEVTGEKAVLSVGLFDGISALRVALDVLEVTVVGHIFVECQSSAQRVVESHFPGALHVNSVQEIDDRMVQSWSQRFGQCNMVLLGSGPPCQGVSGLNSDRRGALRDERSSLFVHVPRVRDLLRKYFPWAPVHSLMESVASMDDEDRTSMSQGVGCEPVFCDAGELTWCSLQSVHFAAKQDLSDVTRDGWQKVDIGRPFPTFTTSRPRDSAGRKPAGIQHCSLEELQAWYDDWYRFPPYQYKHCNCLTNAAGDFRLPDVSEREAMFGFPVGYTSTCGTKSEKKQGLLNDTRLTLLGNSWSVPVVACLLAPLFFLLGFCPWRSPQWIVDHCRAGSSQLVQGRLVRLPLNPVKGRGQSSAYDLAFKLCNLVSVKGEDILLSTPSERVAHFHRLRASVPSKLWKWSIVAGPLRELTVQPATKRRYTLATNSFFTFLKSESLVLPREVAKLDGLVCDYIEHLWSSGCGRALANDTVAGLQDIQPSVRGKLPGAWRLLKTWSVNELPNRAPPLPDHVLLSMVGWALFHGHNAFAISLLVGFFCMLRTGEVLTLRSSHMLCAPADRQVLISLGLTKGGKRHGAAESVVLGYEPAVQLVKLWKSKVSGTTPLATSPAQWRGLFSKCLQELRLNTFEFRPYSLRRGGATFWFGKHQSLDRILVQGRWHTVKSARIYINEGLAILACMRLPISDSRLKPFLTVYHNTLRAHKFQTLEPTAKGRRSGGRGNDKKKTRSRVKMGYGEPVEPRLCLSGIWANLTSDWSAEWYFLSLAGGTSVLVTEARRAAGCPVLRGRADVATDELVLCQR
eukprot:Skav221600  [mRNA]  locus=scaffold1698:515445:521305:+ [translate_table: standard]